MIINAFNSIFIIRLTQTSTVLPFFKIIGVILYFAWSIAIHEILSTFALDIISVWP